MDYYINRNTKKSYVSEFLETQGNDIRLRFEKAFRKIENGNNGRVTRITFKNELFHAPLYEYEIDYKQGFRIYFVKENGKVTAITAGVKKSQKNDIKFCAMKYSEMMTNANGREKNDNI